MSRESVHIYRSELQLFQTLSQAGASVVLNGHNHLYGRNFPIDRAGVVNEANGTVSFSVGTGGRDPLSARELGTFIASAVFGKQGVLGLTLEDESYS